MKVVWLRMGFSGWVGGDRWTLGCGYTVDFKRDWRTCLQVLRGCIFVGATRGQVLVVEKWNMHGDAEDNYVHALHNYVISRLLHRFFDQKHPDHYKVYNL